MLRTIAVALIFACALGLAAVAPVSAAEPTTRTMYVTVVDDSGKAVPGLGPADFAVKENGKDREVASVAPPSEKMRIALMVHQPLLQQRNVRLGLIDFVAKMCPAAEVGLFAISLRAEKVVDYTSDANALVEAIRTMSLIQATGTAVAEAVTEVAKQFDKARPARPVLVLATPEAGMATEDSEYVLNQIVKSKAQFWAVSVGTSAVSIGMADVPRLSGGRVVSIMNLTTFSDGLLQVASDLTSQYLLTYTVPADQKPSERVTVTLKKPGATLRAPSRLTTK
jgi:hypothetical protein